MMSWWFNDVVYLCRGLLMSWSTYVVVYLCRGFTYVTSFAQLLSGREWSGFSKCDIHKN